MNWLLRQTNKNHSALSFLLPFAVVCLFAICALLVTSGGLQIYYEIQHQTNTIYQTRTGVAYLTMKLRQVETADHLSIENNRLVITEEIEGDTYETHIFLNDKGMLTESFVRQGVVPSSGTPIIEAAKFEVSLEQPGLVSFDLTDAEGRKDSASVFLPSQKEVNS